MLKNDTAPVRRRRRAQASYEGAELIEALGGPSHAARLLGVSLDSARRWHERKIIPSEPVLIALRALSGRPPYMERDRRWQGWRFGEDGLLYAPGHNQGWHAGELLARPYERQLIKALQGQLKELQEALSRAHAELDRADPAANERAYR